MSMNTQNFGNQLEDEARARKQKTREEFPEVSDVRMDVLNSDAPRATSGALAEATDPAGQNSSGDVKDANGVSEGFRPICSYSTNKDAVPSTAKAVAPNKGNWPGKKV